MIQKKLKNNLKDKSLLGGKIILMMSVMLAIFTSFASATISLDGVSFDPAIIGAGDEVDIIINFEDVSSNFETNSQFSDNGGYKLHTWIEPSDTITKKYVTFLNSEGDRNIGHLFTGDVWRKNFRVKISDNAPVGTYQFKVLFQYEYNGKLIDVIQEKTFTMNVKKEGITIDLANTNTVPSQIRPGDKFVIISANLENSGLKDAKNVEINTILPTGFEHSYSNNRVYAGLVQASSTKITELTIDLDENVTPGEYYIEYIIDYKDTDNNDYQKNISIPIYVKEKPIIEVINSVGTGLAGKQGELVITIKNTGFEAAESVDVRIIKQNSQPFNFDVRSNYVGELQPGEEGVAIFTFDVNSDAEIKNHDFKVLIRAKGDSDEGDDNIYIYNRRAKFEVTGNGPNTLLRFGLGLGIALIIGLIIINVMKKK